MILSEVNLTHCASNSSSEIRALNTAVQKEGYWCSTMKKWYSLLPDDDDDYEGGFLYAPSSSFEIWHYSFFAKTQMLWQLWGELRSNSSNAYYCYGTVQGYSRSSSVSGI